MQKSFSVNITGIKKSWHFAVSTTLYKLILVLLALTILLITLLLFLVPHLYSLLDDQQNKLVSKDNTHLALAEKNLLLSKQLAENKEQFSHLYSLINSVKINSATTKLTKNKIFASIVPNKEEKKLIFQVIPNGYPIKQPTRISSPYGYRIHPIKKIRHFHYGVDLASPTGTPLYAPAEGVVKYVGTQNGYGKTIIIRHKYGFKTLFAHLSEYKVKRGDRVKYEQLIGLVGNTGTSTGPHLQYEVFFNDKHLNPKYFLKWNNINYSSIFYNVKSVPWQFLTNLIRIQYIKEKASFQMGVPYEEKSN